MPKQKRQCNQCSKLFDEEELDLAPYADYFEQLCYMCYLDPRWIKYNTKFRYQG